MSSVVVLEHPSMMPGPYRLQGRQWLFWMIFTHQLPSITLIIPTIFKDVKNTLRPLGRTRKVLAIGLSPIIQTEDILCQSCSNLPSKSVVYSASMFHGDHSSTPFSLSCAQSHSLIKSCLCWDMQFRELCLTDLIYFLLTNRRLASPLWKRDCHDLLYFETISFTTTF